MKFDSISEAQRHRPFQWVVVASGLILLIPLIAMQFTSEVDWDRMDFAIMGALLTTAGSLFVVASQIVSRSGRVFVGGAVAIAFLYVWAEFSAGI